MEKDIISEHKVSKYSGGVGQVNICNQDAIRTLGVQPGDYVAVMENGVGLNVIPKDVDVQKRHTSSVYPITMTFSEFEARMIGNRLWELSDLYDEEGHDQVTHECRWWARRFHDECNTR